MSPGDSGATIEAGACVVQLGGRRWPFTVDLATGVLTVELGSQAVAVQPLSWREKLTLARYRRADTRLLDAALIEHRLSGAGAGVGVAAGSEEAPERQALVALARWVNGFGAGGDAAPLDPPVLLAIAARACRAAGIAPALLDQMPAADVELLGAATETPPSPRLAAAAPGGAPGVAPGVGPEPDDGLTRILVVPDPEVVVPEPEVVVPEPEVVVPEPEPVPDPEREPDLPLGPEPPAAARRAVDAARPAAVLPDSADLPYLGTAAAAGRTATAVRHPRPQPQPQPAHPHPVHPQPAHSQPRPPRTRQMQPQPLLPTIEPPTIEPPPHELPRLVQPAAGAGLDVEAVLDELARRLEEAVDDLGLDPEG